MSKPKPKKRGRKPGVKVGPYKTKKKIYYDISGKPTDWQPGDKIDNGPTIPKYSPAPVLTLCGQLEDSVMLLENRISNVISKINSLM